MLHVAFLELMTAREQNLFARNVRKAVDQRHYVLQLIAKTKRAARLIERSAGPDAARQRLIEQPTIEHRIHGLVGGSDFNRTQNLIPVVQHILERRVDSSRIQKLR